MSGWFWLVLAAFACYGVYDFIHLNRYRWYRRWKGGKWALWQTSLPMAPVWMNQWERPGCGEYMISQEDWSDGTGIRTDSIMAQEVECTENACDWYGTVDDCLPDVDGDGTIGCPLCQAAVRQVTVTGDAQ